MECIEHISHEFRGIGRCVPAGFGCYMFWKALDVVLGFVWQKLCDADSVVFGDFFFPSFDLI